MDMLNNFGMKRMVGWAWLIVLASCSNDLSNINERDTEDWVAAPVPITGAMLTYDSARVRCHFSRLENKLFQTVCDLVEVLAGGQEVKATKLASGLEVSWAETEVVKGQVDKKTCSPSSDKFKLTCQLEVSSGFAEVKFPVNIEDKIQNKKKVESALVMLPYSVEVAAGFVPFIPFHVQIDQKSASPSVEGRELSRLSPNDVLHGRQAISFQNWDPSLGPIQHFCVADNIGYLVGQHGSANVIYSKNLTNLESEIRFYAGAPHGDNFLGSEIDRFRVQFSNIKDIECDESAVYVASDGRVVRVPHAGAIEVVASIPVNGIAKDKGNFYLVSSETGKVYVYSTSEKALKTLNPQFAAGGIDLSRPEAVTVNDAGEVFVAFEQRRTLTNVGGVMGNTGFEVIAYQILRLNIQTEVLSDPVLLSLDDKKLNSSLPTFRLVADAPGHFFYVLNKAMGQLGPESKNLITQYSGYSDLIYHEKFVYGVLSKPDISQAIIRTSDTQRFTVVNSRTIKVVGKTSPSADQMIFVGKPPMTAIDGSGRSYVCHKKLFLLTDQNQLSELAEDCQGLIASDGSANVIYFYDSIENSIKKLLHQGDDLVIQEYKKLSPNYGWQFAKMAASKEGDLYLLRVDGSSVLKIDQSKAMSNISLGQSGIGSRAGGIAVASNDKPYVGWYRNVFRLSADGTTFEKMEWDLSGLQEGFFGVISDLSVDDKDVLYVSTLENFANAGKVFKLQIPAQDQLSTLEEFLDLGMRSDCVTGKISSQGTSTSATEGLKVSLGNMCGGRAEQFSVLGCSSQSSRYTMLYSQYIYGFFNIIRAQRTCATEETL